MTLSDIQVRSFLLDHLPPPSVLMVTTKVYDLQIRVVFTYLCNFNNLSLRLCAAIPSPRPIPTPTGKPCFMTTVTSRPTLSSCNNLLLTSTSKNTHEACSSLHRLPWHGKPNFCLYKNWFTKVDHSVSFYHARWQKCAFAFHLSFRRGSRSKSFCSLHAQTAPETSQQPAGGWMTCHLTRRSCKASRNPEKVLFSAGLVRKRQASWIKEHFFSNAMSMIKRPNTTDLQRPLAARLMIDWRRMTCNQTTGWSSCFLFFIFSAIVWGLKICFSYFQSSWLSFTWSFSICSAKSNHLFCCLLRGQLACEALFEVRRCSLIDEQHAAQRRLRTCTYAREL